MHAMALAVHQAVLSPPRHVTCSAQRSSPAPPSGRAAPFRAATPAASTTRLPAVATLTSTKSRTSSAQHVSTSGQAESPRHHYPDADLARILPTSVDSEWVNSQLNALPLGMHATGETQEMDPSIICNIPPTLLDSDTACLEVALKLGTTLAAMIRSAAGPGAACLHDVEEAVEQLGGAESFATPGVARVQEHQSFAEQYRCIDSRWYKNGLVRAEKVNEVSAVEWTMHHLTEARQAGVSNLNDYAPVRAAAEAVAAAIKHPAHMRASGAYGTTPGSAVVYSISTLHIGELAVPLLAVGVARTDTDSASGARMSFAAGMCGPLYRGWAVHARGAPKDAWFLPLVLARNQEA